MPLEFILLIFFAAFLLEFFDASAGMGYGEIAALLLLLGFAPLEVIPSVILTGSVLSLSSGVLHHSFKNVDFSFGSKEFKLALVLVAFGIIGILIGVTVAIHLSENILKIYIGLLILIMGLIILVKRDRKSFFGWLKKKTVVWQKIIGFGALAAFNKGMSGGGFGPVLTSGQLLSGVESKKAVAISSLVEGIVALFGVLAYVSLSGTEYFNWPLIIVLFSGGIIAVPFAVYSVKKIDPRKLRTAIGVLSVILGTAILSQLFL